MRVYEVAKELSVTSEALVHLLREMDVPVRSHMTQLGEEHIARLRPTFEATLAMLERETNPLAVRRPSAFGKRPVAL